MSKTRLAMLAAVATLAAVALVPSPAAAQRLPYQDVSLPVKQRVEDLLSR
jgi:hypothetical protein